jgi:two-component system NtrC family sensor kinase
MKGYLKSLKRFHDGFVDVGFFNARGIQIGYAGPHPQLRGRNYSDQPWFQELGEGNLNYLVTDIYTGLRNIPHFTIAVRQVIDGTPYIMRATLDPDKLYIFLRAISHGKEVETTLINAQGQYQVVDPGHSPFPSSSSYVPPTSPAAGVEEIRLDERPTLIAYAWLQETPWALLVMQPAAVAQSGMYRARLILTTTLAAVSLLVSLIIFITIRKVVADARKMAEKGHQLQEMLAHASKLASIGELAAGVAHEINNPLAIIMATSGVIRDMLTPEFELDHSPEAICKELSTIDTAANRAKGITKRLQEMGKTRLPQTTLCDINALIEEVLNRLKRVEFKGKHLEVVTSFSAELPQILTEPEPLSQVVGNILVNAADAIDDTGTITVSTAMRDWMVSVTIADTGRGIPSENLQRIFNPFFTTKGSGRSTGLGLSIAASIVKYMGGTIKVNSIPGSGSSFTVLLPVKQQQRE